MVRVPIEVRFTLDAGSPFVRVRVSGANTARDHRLRIVLTAGIPDPVVVADAAFGPVERRPVRVPDEDAAREIPPATAPLHRYVSLFGAARGVTVFSDGLAEYEATPDGAVAVTLVRAVGELSRPNLPERPGHAGWPMPTPGAQSLGPFAAELAVMPHGARSAGVEGAVARAADDVLLPLVGTTLRSALRVPPPSGGIELAGEGLAFSAAKESESGEWLVARCVNVTGESVIGAWRFGFPVGEARLARLDETPLDALSIVDGAVPFTAPPRAVVTVLVR
jgi:alpha-mannosidase